MAYIGSHDGYGKTFHGFPTPDSFVLKHSIQDSPYPQDFNGRLQLPQIYTDLPCQELNAHCPACGHSDISAPPSLISSDSMSSDSPSPVSEAGSSRRRRPYPRQSRNAKNQHGKQYPERSPQMYNASPFEMLLEPSWYFDKVEEFISRQRALISEGWPIENVFGKETINVQAFFAPEEQTIEPVTVAEWVVYATQSPDILGVPERLGFMLLGALLLRWRIAPTAQNYIMLPAFMRPTSAQLAVPHNAWIDFLPWPEVRDAMIMSPNEYVKVAQNRMYLFGLISANWRRSPANIIASGKHGDRVALSFAFQHHVCNGANWTIDEEAVSFSSIFASRTRI